MSDIREKEALKAYLMLLRKKGASEDMLEEREALLLRLTEVVADKPGDIYLYRDAVEDLLETIDRMDRPVFLLVAREYYPFWIGDIKTIAMLYNDEELNFDPNQWRPKEINLKEIWGVLDKEKFSVAENWPLKAYVHALRQEGAEQTLVDVRAKLVKLLLVRLRDAPEKCHKNYRIAVDATMPLFDMRDVRNLFLVVVREFYYFWSGDPDAAEYVLNERQNKLF